MGGVLPQTPYLSIYECITIFVRIGGNAIGPMLGPPSLNTLAVGQHRPEFAARIQNITVNVGREAVLECHVNHLGRYKVRDQQL